MNECLQVWTWNHRRKIWKCSTGWTKRSCRRLVTSVQTNPFKSQTSSSTKQRKQPNTKPWGAPLQDKYAFRDLKAWRPFIFQQPTIGSDYKPGSEKLQVAQTPGCLQPFLSKPGNVPVGKFLSLLQIRGTNQTCSFIQPEWTEGTETEKQEHSWETDHLLEQNIVWLVLQSEDLRSRSAASLIRIYRKGSFISVTIYLLRETKINSTQTEVFRI